MMARIKKLENTIVTLTANLTDAGRIHVELSRVTETLDYLDRRVTNGAFSTRSEWTEFVATQE